MAEEQAGRRPEPGEETGETGEEPSPGGAPEDEEDDDQFWAQPAPRDPAFGFWVVFVGLLAVVAVFTVAVFKHDNANDIVTIIAPAFAAIAGLVGAYFGLRAGTLAARQITEAVHPPAGGGKGSSRRGGGDSADRAPARRARIGRAGRGRR